MDYKLKTERRCDIATTKLSVAENLRWVVAGPFAFLIYLKYESWILAAVVGVIIFVLVVHWYEKEYDAANDACEQLTRTGKYYKPSEPNEAG